MQQLKPLQLVVFLKWPRGRHV